MSTIEEAARRLGQLPGSGVAAAERPAPGELSYAAWTPPSSEPAPPFPLAAARSLLRIERMNSERRRMTSSLLLSLLFHGLLLSLTFGGQGLGLPTLSFPWQERRVEVPELRVVLVPEPITPAATAVQSAAGPAPHASIDPRVAGNARALTPPALPAPLQGRALENVPVAKPEPNAVAAAAPARASTRSDESRDAMPAKIPDTAAIDVAPSGRPELLVPIAPTAPDVITAAPSASSPETVMPANRGLGDLTPQRVGPDVREQSAALAEQAAQLEAARAEAAKREGDLKEEEARVAARMEAKREEAAQLAAAQLEAERQETARQEVAARIEAARRAAAQLEAERLMAARQEAARIEAARAAQVEAERQEAIRQETAARIEAARRAAAQAEAERRPAVRQEASPVEPARTAQPQAQRQEPTRPEKARAETARPQAERQEPAQPAAAPQEVARGDAEKEEERKREERRRAIGRQLDEEAAQREAPNAARQLPLSLSTARRARLWGRGDPNVELVQYAEGWARKIQFNTPVATVRDVAKQPHRHPVVTVAIRSDGSVESVTFVISSGVPQVDEAIRHIVQSHEHYQAFPATLAREYDVIEIRRTWHFSDTVGLY